MANLFEEVTSHLNQPLAFRMRPKSLNDFIGQEAIMGEGRLLRRAIKADQISNLIFYGPPGTGKTTLAQLIAVSTQAKFVSLNAVLSGVKELREALDEAKEQKSLYNRKTILFIDEVHRWNKSQQDALLPWTENGTVILIGATTENPFFEVNRALVSRSRIFALQTLTPDDLKKAANKALTDKEKGYGNYKIEFEKGALEHLIDVAQGDCRTFYNALELAVETTPGQFPPQNPEEPIVITVQIASESIQKRALLYDKDGDYHYDTISAFIKSVRGSDPDAALYWLARMLLSGEDPSFILRRLLILASEDIGLADPNAVVVVNNCALSYERLGMPEGRFPLSQATLYLATAPKSNSTLALFDALKEVESEKSYEVPNHLKDSSRDGKTFGHGQNYRYPHAFTDHWVAQAYLPDNLKGKTFYKPGYLGYEGQLAKQIEQRKEAQLALSADMTEDFFSFSPDRVAKNRNYWLARTEEVLGDQLLFLRGQIFNTLPQCNHLTTLHLADHSGFLLTEALRRYPSGGHYSFLQNEEQKKVLQEQFKRLLPEERPIFISQEKELPSQVDSLLFFFPKNLNNEMILPKTTWVAGLLNGVGSRLSQFVDLGEELKPLLQQAEELTYASLAEEAYLKTLEQLGFRATLHRHTWLNLRVISKVHIENWLKGDLGLHLKSLSSLQYSEIEKTLMALAGREVAWERLVYWATGKKGWPLKK